MIQSKLSERVSRLEAQLEGMRKWEDLRAWISEQRSDIGGDYDNIDEIDSGKLRILDDLEVFITSKQKK
jgi:hypothetical protein